MFKERSSEKELMDSSDFDPVLSAQSFRFIETVNRFFGGTGIVKNFILSEARKLNHKKALQVLDIGSGSCDIPVSICKYASKAGIPLEFSCVETSTHAVKRASRAIKRYPGIPIRILQENIFSHTPDRIYDIAVGSMFFHHLQDREILSLIKHLRPYVRNALLINDLERGWMNYLGALLLTLPESPGVRNDAILSVRKGFRINELSRLFETISFAEFQAERCFPFRIKGLISLDRPADKRSH